MSIPTYGMESKRILLSDKYFHTMDLSEETLGVIQHALYVLHHAFVAEPEYLKLIDKAAGIIAKELEQPSIHRP